MDEANFVQILHDDGTHAIYAHLQLDTVRVKIGQRVARGEYIANSGNTGFSTGPHLHFVVLRNIGLRSESVPVAFAGPGGASVHVAERAGADGVLSAAGAGARRGARSSSALRCQRRSSSAVGGTAIPSADTIA